MSLVGSTQITEAAATLEGVAVRTPLEYSRALSSKTGGASYLKCENLQRTGSFKIRGAYNRISQLSLEERAKGVVAASAGNHAQGVALAASLLDVKATVFMPNGAPLPKVAATSRYGAEVMLEGDVYDEAFAAAEQFARDRGAVMVHPFDHPHIIAGQGTVGLEILEQLPEVAAVIVPVGGGGLISGIASAIKLQRPEVKVFGVEPEGAANVSRAVKEGKVVELPSLSTVADGLSAKKAGELCLAHVQERVDEIVIVTDDEIAEALLLLAERAKLVVEPAGAAAMAALMSGKIEAEFPLVAVLSGGNIDPLLLLKVLRFGMGSAGRYFSFRTRTPDRPGELHRLLGVIAAAGANVVGVEHHREGPSLRHLGEVEIAIQVETRGRDHVDELIVALAGAGYSVDRL